MGRDIYVLPHRPTFPLDQGDIPLTKRVAWPAGRPTGQDSLLVGRISPGQKVMYFAGAPV